MTDEEIRRILIDELSNLAPECNPAAIDAEADLREALDLDSMDFLNLVIALHERLGIDIPESDYGAMRSLKGAIEYLAARTNA
jgi:acyl carrier protein